MHTRSAIRAGARLAMLVAMLAASATPAWSRVTVRDGGSYAFVRVFYRFFGPPDSQPRTVYEYVYNPDTCATWYLKNPSPECQTDPNSNCFYHHITASGCVDRSTTPATISSYALVDGNASAGPHGLTTSAVGDTASAEGLGRVSVLRALNLVTLSNLVVQLRNNPGSLGNPGGMPAPTRTRFILAVYPDTLAAIADQDNLRGTGARFFGVVDLVNGANPLRATAPVPGVPGFAASDFVLTSLLGGVIQATPADTFLRAIFVPNASSAAVVMSSDPAAGFDAALPLTGPGGMLAIAAALLASGLWFMRARRRTSIG